MTRGVPAGTDWTIFGDCPGCGARAATACFRHNGSRARQACLSRPFTPDGIHVRFEEDRKEIEALRTDVESLRSLVLRQQRQIDVLLGEIE